MGMGMHVGGCYGWMGGWMGGCWELGVTRRIECVCVCVEIEVVVIHGLIASLAVEHYQLGARVRQVG